MELGPLPPRARDVQRHMAQYMKTLFGLRYAVGEYRPMPFAASVPVRRGIVDDKGNASRVIRSLVVMRVVLCVGALAPLEERGPLARDHGTKLYTPPQPKGESEKRRCRTQEVPEVQRGAFPEATKAHHTHCPSCIRFDHPTARQARHLMVLSRLLGVEVPDVMTGRDAYRVTEESPLLASADPGIESCQAEGCDWLVNVHKEGGYCRKHRKREHRD